jgi:hypothetical protein
MVTVVVTVVVMVMAAVDAVAGARTRQEKTGDVK